MSNSLWRYFVNTVGVEGSFLHLKDSIYKWWNTDASTKLIPILKAIPMFILWQVWKRRNIIRCGGKMSYLNMSKEMAKIIFPGQVPISMEAQHT
uniref:Putative ovule protein n=1 Tax=Solanum chacoense TaxID=4108 RepID=A0A0V0H0Q7_SOLCH